MYKVNYISGGDIYHIGNRDKRSQAESLARKWQKYMDTLSKNTGREKCQVYVVDKGVPSCGEWDWVPVW